MSVADGMVTQPGDHLSDSANWRFRVIIELIFLAALAVVHIGFALNILADGDELRSQGSKPLLAGTLLWCLATLLGGVFVAAIYWLVNHSTLSRR